MRSGLHHGSLERIGTEYKMKLDIYRIDVVFRLTKCPEKYHRTEHLMKVGYITNRSYS